MGKYKNKTYPLRLDNELMEKVRIIAELEDRKISDQLTKIIREYVIKYEMQHDLQRKTSIRELVKASEMIEKAAKTQELKNVLDVPAYASGKTKIFETKTE